MKMRRQLNIRFLAILLVSTILLGAGVHTLHGFQVDRSAVLLQKRAEQAEQAGDLEEAEKNLKRYLGYVPNDVNALAKYGLLLDQRAETQDQRLQALFVLERVLRQDPEREEIRRRLATLDVEVQRFTDAEDHLWADRQYGLLRNDPEDGELLLLLGRCREAAGLDRQKDSRTTGSQNSEDFLQKAGAAELYQAAIEHAPDQIEGYVQYARLLRDRLDNTEQAGEIIDEMVSANGQDFRAYLERIQFRGAVDVEDSEADIAKALELAPDDAEVLLIAAALASETKNFDQAREHLEHGIEEAPEDVRFYQTLAGVESQAGRFEQALAALERGLEAVPNESSLQIARIETYLQAEKLDQAEAEIARLLERRNVASSVPMILHARALMGRQRWAEAIDALDRAQRYTAELTPEARQALLTQADFLLAQCHQRLGNTAEQLATYRRILGVDRRSLPARLGEASALLALGRTDEALTAYRRILPDAPGVAPTVARLLILEIQRRPEAQRNWREIDQVLDAASQTNPESVEVTLLRVEALAGRGELQAARDLLEEARATAPDEVDLWVTLAALVERQEGADAALARLVEAQEQLGDRVELRLARIGPILRRGDENVSSALADLESHLEPFDNEEQARLLNGLAEAHARLGDPEQARLLWQRVVKLDPNQVEARVVLFDYALQEGNLDSMRLAVEAIRKAEGENGVLWRYCEAARLVTQAGQGDQSGLPRARAHLNEVALRRPEWSRAPMLQGRVAELENDPARAIERYQKAVELGEGRPAVVGQLAQLLNSQERFKEAEQTLEKLPEGASMLGPVGQTAATLALRNGHREKALELARQAIDPASENHRDHLWLGQFLAAAEEYEAAEASLRRAAELGGEDPQVWVSLVQFLTARERPDEVKAVIEQAKAALPPDQAPLALAACYEATGDRDEAEKQYRVALDAAPNDVERLNNLIAFYMRTGQANKAEPLLKRVIDRKVKVTDQELVQARRAQALAVLMSSGTRRVPEALQLVEANLQVDAGSIEDRRLKALLLATQPRRRREAIRTVEDLSKGQALAPGEQFLLAQLYLAEEDWFNARRQMLSLLGSEDGNNPQFVAFFANALLNRGDTREAVSWVNRLERLDPESFQTVGIKARLLKNQDRPEEAAKLLQAHADRQENQARAVAALLENLELPDEAEAMYRKAAAQAEQPDNALALAGFLGRQGRLTEALDIIEARWGQEGSNSETLATGALTILYGDMVQPDAQQSERVARLLDKALQEGNRTPTLVFQLANLRLIQGEYSEAARLFRESTQIESGNSGPLNNLAWLLALHEGKRAEALSQINKAIELDGLDPELLDTRAVIHLSMDRPDLALEDLLEATARLRSGPLLFHLALVHQKAGDRAEAAKALEQAKAAGFQREMIHPLEQEAFADLIRQLGPI